MSKTSTAGCWFCNHDRGDDAPPTGWIYEDEHWLAGHAPASYGPAGLVILESKRHFLDATEMTEPEAGSFGAVLGSLTAAIKKVIGAERVYTWASMAHSPHMHVWLIPWTPGKPEGPRFLSAVGTFACTSQQADEAAKALRLTLQT